MVADALAIPFDITWHRLAFSADMVDRSFSDGAPPLWRPSLSVYAYPVPLADTVAEYPDHRIVYLKLSMSITGSSPQEMLPAARQPIDNDPTDDPPPDPDDEWQDEGWTHVDESAPLRDEYWGCNAAIAQLAVYPRPEADVPVEDFPFIVDFEPKKRELYEAVTENSEVLSGSTGNTNIRKGSTSTHSAEVSASFGIGTGSQRSGPSGRP